MILAPESSVLFGTEAVLLVSVGHMVKIADYTHKKEILYYHTVALKHCKLMILQNYP